MYIYREELKKDVKEWIEENKEMLEGEEKDSMYDIIYDSCWVSDEVTGNASGSYTFSRYEARRNIYEDIFSDDYIGEMVEEGFVTEEDIGKHISSSDWEWLDVSIRCYLLGQVVQEVVDEMD